MPSPGRSWRRDSRARRVPAVAAHAPRCCGSACRPSAPPTTRERAMSTAPSVDQRYYDAERETMPRADLEALQLELLQAMVAHAYERAPLYREVWDDAGFHPRDLRALDDFTARVPFISKD